MILYYILVTFSSQVSHTGKNAFSLDGAKTKFPSLEHLVDFHKMNSGALPTILQDCALGTKRVSSTWALPECLLTDSSNTARELPSRSQRKAG